MTFVTYDTTIVKDHGSPGGYLQRVNAARVCIARARVTRTTRTPSMGVLE